MGLVGSWRAHRPHLDGVTVYRGVNECIVSVKDGDSNPVIIYDIKIFLYNSQGETNKKIFRVTIRVPISEV